MKDSVVPEVALLALIFNDDDKRACNNVFFKQKNVLTENDRIRVKG